MTTATIQTILDNYEDHVIALALHLETILPDTLIDTTIQTDGINTDELTEALDDAEKLIDDNDYLSLTDVEADDAEDERLESYIDDCILHELPEPYRVYFDRKSWKDDARMDGR